jgi:hypothetical protein
VYRLHINYHMTKKIRIILLILDFKLGTVDNRKDYLQTWGEFFFCIIYDKTNISLTFKILHLRQGSFTRKVRTIFPLKIIVSIFVKIFLILDLHLRQFFIVRRATDSQLSQIL